MILSLLVQMIESNDNSKRKSLKCYLCPRSNLSPITQFIQMVGVLPEGFRYPFAASCEFFEPIRFTAVQRRYRGIHS